MLKKMFKILTLVSFLGLSTSAFASYDQSTFTQLKKDMWLMGLDFEYQDGGNIVHQFLQEEPEEEMPAQEISNLELIHQAIEL